MSIGGRIQDGWRHDVRISGGEIRVDGCRRPVTLRRDEVTIGCTVVGRDVIERLAAEFAKHYPEKTTDQVLIQF